MSSDYTGSSIGKIVAVTGNFKVPKFWTRRMKMKSQRSVALHAAELHERAIVIDCHSDILMPTADGYVRLGKQVEVPDPERWKPSFEMTESSAGDRGWPLRPLSDRFGCIGQYSIPQFLGGNYMRVFEQVWKA